MSGGWIKDHKKELLGVLALGGVGALTGGFGLLGAGAAAGAEAGAGAAAGGLAGMDAVGAGAGGMDLLSSGAMANMPNGLHALSGDLGGGLLGKAGNALDKFGKVQKLAGLLNPEQPAPPPPMPRGGGVQQAPMASVPTPQQMYGPATVDPETLRRRLAALRAAQGLG